MTHQDEPFDTLPPAIVDALRQLDEPAVQPDPLRDARVLAQAGEHLAQVAALQRKRRAIRLFFAGGAGSAIAAMLLLALILIGPGKETNTANESLAALPPASVPADQPLGDLDQNGTLDILDAYALARHVERGQASEAFDLNGDGQVNQQDIDWIANQAVALQIGERG